MGLISPILLRLMGAFPNSFINYIGEFIADKDTNQWFRLEDCYSERDVKCKVIEWLSRSACKTTAYRSSKKNQEFHERMLKGINSFLETSFTEDEMMEIYTYLGNAVNHDKTVLFIESDYDMRILTDEEYCEHFKEKRMEKMLKELNRVRRG